MTENITTLTRNGFEVEIERLKVNLPVKAIRDLPLSGDVYLIKCCQFYKIGASAQIKKRIAAIQSIVPFEVEIVDFFLSCDVFQDEKKIHRLCSEFNVKNEWFLLPDSFVKNRAKWFKPSVSPIPQINQGIVKYMKAVDDENDVFPELTVTGVWAYKPKPDQELMRTCFLLDAEIGSQIIAARFNIDVAEVHNDRYRGLYRMNAKELRTDGGLDKAETPLDALSTYDLTLNSLANQRAKMMGNPNAIFAVANTLREGHEKDMGSPLKPTWEEKRLRPNQAKAIAFNQEYQTELPVS